MEELEKKYNKILNIQYALKEPVVKYDAKCIHERTNWANMSIFNLIERGQPKQEITMETIKYSSPKLYKLMEHIKELDTKDMKETGKMYKHFIYTDFKTRKYGINVIASALLLNGWTLAYKSAPVNTAKKWGKIEIKTDAELADNRGYNFFVLPTRTIYNQSITMQLKRNILGEFNKRPDNIYGENVRIIIMDSGYKEGIDLFDIKYIHVFEPLETASELKQVIGRGTRTCGQKGLPFDAQVGWELFVYIYDIIIPEYVEKLFNHAESAFDLYLLSINYDYTELNFINALEKLLYGNAVDKSLTESMHNYRPDRPEERKSGGGNTPASSKELKTALLKTELRAYNPPKQPYKTAEDMNAYIKREYGDFSWIMPEFKNGCVSKEGAKQGLFELTMTQQFIANYFTPSNFAKGMLLWHSVGTGKTCTAINAASKSFEMAGYTILWVTRSTLKNDIWKNMFEATCNYKLRQYVEEGGKFPKELKEQKKYLSNSWQIEPMSYKQFTNLIEGKNQIHKKLVSINGDLDPLYKTLIIIDEAHKLYGGYDLTAIERPNMDKFRQAVFNSYQLNGENSVRLLLLTATPIIKNPMEIINILNLFKPLNQQLPNTYPSFQEKYLTVEGEFTESGLATFKNETAGYISYLNLEKDARQFAQPIIRHINLPLLRDKSEIFQIDKQFIHEYFYQFIHVLEKRINYLTLLKTIHPNPYKPYLLNYFDCSKIFKEAEATSVCLNIVKKNQSELEVELEKSYNEILDEISDVIMQKNELLKLQQDAIIHIEKTYKKIQTSTPASSASISLNLHPPLSPEPSSLRTRATLTKKATLQQGGAATLEQLIDTNVAGIAPVSQISQPNKEILTTKTKAAVKKTQKKLVKPRVNLRAKPRANLRTKKQPKKHITAVEYKNTPFYLFRTKCKEVIKLNKVIMDYVDTMPEVVDMAKKIKAKSDIIEQKKSEIKILQYLVKNINKKHDKEGIKVSSYANVDAENQIDKREKDIKEYKDKMEKLHAAFKNKLQMEIKQHKQLKKEKEDIDALKNKLNAEFDDYVKKLEDEYNIKEYIEMDKQTIEGIKKVVRSLMSSATVLSNMMKKTRKYILDNLDKNMLKQLNDVVKEIKDNEIIYDPIIQKYIKKTKNELSV